MRSRPQRSLGAPRREAVILAGGQSSRMGQDKARLRVGGRSFLAHIRDACRGAGLSVRVVRRDLRPGCGPLGGIQTALRTTKAEMVVFLSCDMPLVTPRLLQDVLSRLRADRPAAFVGTKYAGFPFALRREGLRVVEEQLSAGRLSLQDLAGKLNAELISRPRSATALRNVNSPEELAAVRKWWRQRQARLDRLRPHPKR